MKIYEEKSLSNFEFWSGAKDRTCWLTDRDFDIIENTFEELYPDGMEDTQINDMFWFDEDWVAEILGYSDWEELEEDRSEDE